MDQLYTTLHNLTPYIPPTAKNILSSQSTRSALAILAGLYLIRKVNNGLSHGALNNWQSAKPWKPENELAVVTGGSSGIGNSLAFDLTRQGVKVIVLDIQEPKDLPSNAHFIKTDITIAESIKNAADIIRKEHGEPTILINNAGVFYNGTILDEPESLIRRTLNVNTFAHFLTAKEFLPSMIEKNHGHIAIVASMAGHLCLGEMVDYASAKAGAVAFYEGITQELRLWHKAPKIRTSLILPMWVDTPLITNLTTAGDKFNQPVLDTKIVSEAIVNQIVAQKSGQIILPAYSTAVSYIRSFPIWLQEAGRNFGSGIIKNVRDEVWSKST